MADKKPSSTTTSTTKDKEGNMTVVINNYYNEPSPSTSPGTPAKEEKRPTHGYGHDPEDGFAYAGGYD